jgi:O-antigen ligase
MPPPLALLLCTIFVIFLIRLEHKQAPELSRYMLIPTIWMLVIFSKPLDVWFGNAAQDTMESGSPLDRIFLIVVLCLGLLILLRKKFDWPSAIKENYWLVFLVVYMLVSILWSDIPYISFKRWTRELVAGVMAFLVFSERDPHQAVLSILRRLIYILIPFSHLLIKYYPAYGVEYGRWSGYKTWIGVSSQKNGLARLCIVSALFLIWTLYRRWRGLDVPVVKYQTHIEIFLLFLTFWLLMGPDKTFAYSATSTVSLIVALLALAGFFWIKKRGFALGANALKAVVFLIIVYGTVTPMVGKLSVLDVSSSFGRDQTLTGRSDIWAILVPFAMSRPILGHGVGGFWTTAMRNLTSSHAHNGYLDAVLSLGFVGLLMVSMFLLSCCQRAQRAITYDFDWGILFVCYLIMTMVYNISESTIDSLCGSLTAIILFFSVSSLKISMVEEKLAKVMHRPKGSLLR